MDYAIILFYKYTSITEPNTIREFLFQFGNNHNLKGRLILANEGINGTLTGLIDTILTFQSILEELGLHNIEYKAELTNEHKFPKWSVKVRNEIVALRHEVDVTKCGKHIDSKTFNKLSASSNILDVRSNYEHLIGKFKGAITLDIDNFSEFPEVVSNLEISKEKPLITYCTGGIKCEKASAFLLQNGFKNVYQLDGGIIKYKDQCNAEDFEGECYVSDSRVKVPVNKINKIISKCCRCKQGSSNITDCNICNKQVILCHVCIQQWKYTCSNYCWNYNNTFSATQMSL